MTFMWPVMLLLLLIIPAFVVMYLRMQQQRKRLAERHGSMGFIRGPGKKDPGLRRHIPPIFFMAALAILIFAMARPLMLISLPRIEGTVILAFDASGSMAADDFQPTRMDAAKAAARSFVDKQPPGVLVGVVSFSDGGLSVQAATNDPVEVIAAINRLMPQRGTSLANGIYAALTAIEASRNEPTNFYSNVTPTPAPSPTPMPKGVYDSAVIVLLTDGENTSQPDPLEAAQIAADRGVRIHTVGIGSAAGSDLSIEGFTIRTRLDEATLQQVALMTGGTYYNATDEDQLLRIYENLSPQLVVKPERMEITSLLAGLGIFIMLIGGAFSLMWFSRLP